jgi:predicted amidohydrolase
MRRVSSIPYAAACQTDFRSPADRSEIAERTRRMGEMVEQTITGYEPFFDVRLLAFPEFAHAAPAYDSVATLRDRLAIPVPNEHTDHYEKLARHYGCYIQTGTFLEADPAHPDLVFNTTALIGPDGLLSKYRKVNPWIPWEIHASPHDVPDYGEDPFPVTDTEIGRIGAAICYDWLFPETIRQIAFNGAEIIVRVSAYMDPWGATPPLDWWTLVNRTRALENSVFVVAANQGASLAHYPPFSWPGASRSTWRPCAGSASAGSVTTREPTCAPRCTPISVPDGSPQPPPGNRSRTRGCAVASKLRGVACRRDGRRPAWRAAPVDAAPVAVVCVAGGSPAGLSRSCTEGTRPGGGGGEQPWGWPDGSLRLRRRSRGLRGARPPASRVARRPGQRGDRHLESAAGG